MAELMIVPTLQKGEMVSEISVLSTMVWGSSAPPAALHERPRSSALHQGRWIVESPPYT